MDLPEAQELRLMSQSGKGVEPASALYGGTVSVIDTATNTVVGSPIVVGNSPQDVAITPDGRFAYVTNALDNTVSVINTATKTLIGPASPVAGSKRPLGSGPVQISGVTSALDMCELGPPGDSKQQR